MAKGKYVTSPLQNTVKEFTAEQPEKKEDPAIREAENREEAKPEIEPFDTVDETAPQEKEPAQSASKSKVKTGKNSQKKEIAYKRINLKLPVDIYELVITGAAPYRGNITTYLNELILADAKKNKEKYEEMRKLLAR